MMKVEVYTFCKLDCSVYQIHLYKNKLVMLVPGKNEKLEAAKRTYDIYFKDEELPIEYWTKTTRNLTEQEKIFLL